MKASTTILLNHNTQPWKSKRVPAEKSADDSTNESSAFSVLESRAGVNQTLLWKSKW